MKNIFLTQIYIAVLLLIIVGCYKDKGNYDYSSGNSIEVNNIDSVYVIMAGSTLQIKPSLSTTDGSNVNDTTRYRYYWRKELPTGQQITLSDSINLSVAISEDKFTFNQINTIYFVAIDELTGARSQFVASINVQTETAFVRDGWFVLSEFNNGSLLSMISHVNNANQFYPNVLQSVGSRLMLEEYGKPFSLTVDHGRNLTINTEKNSVYLPVTDGLSWDESLTTLNRFIQPLPNGNIIAYAGALDVQTKETNLVYANSNFYIESPQYEELFGEPINQYSDATSPFKASPYFGAFWQERGALMFDEDKRQFALYRLSFSANYAQPMLSLQVEGESMTNLPRDKELRYMSKVRYTGERGQVYAILKGTDDRYSLLRFEGRIGTRTTIVLKAPEEYIQATDFDKAEFITVNPLYGYIYYNVGSKVYAYDPIGTKSSKLMLDFGNEDITLLSFDASNNRSYLSNPNELNKLVIGTYVASSADEKKGKLRFYTVPSAMAQITQAGDTYTGFGRIKSVAYINN